MKKFYVIEGLDFVGKTTQVQLLSDYLGAFKIGTPHGSFKKIRWLFDKSHPVLKFLFYVMANMQVSSIVKKELILNDVVCDRYFLSTLAYHNALGVKVDAVDFRKLNIIFPKMVFYLILDSEKIYQERVGQRSSLTREEGRIIRDQNFKKKIHDYYMNYSVTPIFTDNKNIEGVLNEILEHLHKNKSSFA